MAQSLAIRIGKLNALNLFAKVSGFLLLYIVTKNIEVDTFGYYSKIYLYAQYVGLIHFGFISSASRIIPISKTIDTPLIINSTLILEGVQTTLIVIILILVGIFDEKFFYVIPIFIGQRVSTVLSSILIATKNFKYLNVYRLIYGVLSPLIATLVVMYITPVYYLMYLLVGAMCILPIMLEIVSVRGFKVSFIVLKQYLDANFIDGIRLQFRSLSFWGYRMADGLIVSTVFNSEDYGVYAFAVSLILYLRLVLGDAHNLMQPYIWRWLDLGYEIMLRKLNRLNLLFLLGSILIYIFSLLLVPKLIEVFLPNYTRSVAIFEILAFNILLIGSTGVMTIVGSSKTNDLVNISRSLYIGGILFYGLFYAFKGRVEVNLLSVAYVSIIFQFIILFIEWIYGLKRYYRLYRIFSSVIVFNSLILILILWF